MSRPTRTAGMALAALLSGCSALANVLPHVDPLGCMTQVPASYQVQAAIPVGSIAVRVTDASGSPVASESVSVWRNVYTGTT